MSHQLLRVNASGTVKTGPAVTIVFPTVTTNDQWTGTVSVPTSPPDVTWTASVGGQPLQSWLGTSGFGPVTLVPGEALTIVGAQPATSPTPLTLGASIAATMLGSIDDYGSVPFATPIPALSSLSLSQLTAGTINGGVFIGPSLQSAGSGDYAYVKLQGAGTPGANSYVAEGVNNYGDIQIVGRYRTNAIINGGKKFVDDTGADVVLGAVPIGSMMAYAPAAASLPLGWILCDGKAVSRSRFAALFALIGTTYGAGDGVTTFNVPDLRSRTPVGAGQGAGLSNRVLGTTGGEETHTLTTAEVAAHNHGGATGGESATHTHTQAPQTAVSTGSTIGLSPVATNQAAFSAAFSTGTESAGHTHSVAGDGGGGAHNNMQPWLALNWIIHAGTPFSS